MWFAEVPGEQIHRADRWTAAFFNQAKITSKAAFPMRLIGLIAAERRGTSDPQLLGNSQINYLGLENVRSLTGELCDFSPRPAASIKSRSKLFKLGDVLYGRLRPELNKVTVPSLVLVGEHDEATPPPMSHELNAGLPDSRLKIMAGCAHVPQLQSPGKFLDAIGDFLQG